VWYKTLPIFQLTCLTPDMPTYKTRWMYCVECSQYSIRLEGYLCTGCLLPAFDDGRRRARCEWAFTLCHVAVVCFMFHAHDVSGVISCVFAL